MSRISDTIMRTMVYQRIQTMKVVFSCVWRQTKVDGKFAAGCVPCRHEKSMCSKVRKLIDKGKVMHMDRARYLEDINDYNCTLSYLANKLDIPLWQAMEIVTWYTERRKGEEKDEC